MQKLFKRSLAMVLSIMMIITMFSGMTFVTAAEAYTSNEPASVGALWHMADLLATDSSYTQYNNMHYLAQEFVPGTNTISGVDLSFLLTSGSGVMHLELRKDDPNSAAVYSKDIPFVSRGNYDYQWYEFNFGEDVAVTAGDVYYLCFWLKSKSSMGNTAIYQGGAASGDHTAYYQKMFSDTTLTAPTNLAKTGNAIPFRIKSGTGVNTLLAHADTESFVVYPAGNMSGSNDTNGSRYTDAFTEGGASNKSHWGATVELNGTGKMFFCTTGIGGKDLTKAKYVTFDMYVHGFDWNPNSASNPALYFGTAGGNWSASDLMDFKIQSFMPESLKEGWNHIVIPLETATWNATPTNVGVLSLRWDGGDQAVDGTSAVKFSATDAYVLFDNVRALDDAAYLIVEGLAEEIAAVEALIAALPATDALTQADAEAVTAAKAAYDALPAAAQAEVSNAALLTAAIAKLQSLIPLDVVYRDFETNGSLANEGYVNRTTVDGLDGKAVKFEFTQDKTGGLFWYFYPENHDTTGAGGINIANTEYITFDMYVSDASKFTYGGDYRINLYSTDGSTSCGQVTAASVSAMFKGLKTGWNHVVMPVALNAGAPTTAWKLRLYSSSGSAPAGAYTIVDDMRFVNQAALDTVIAKRTAAKDVTLAIQALPAVDALTLENKAAVEAVAAAYAAVDADYTAIVKGVDTLTAAQAKIAELQAAADQAAADKAAADAVKAQIAALNVQSLEDKAAVEAARAAYDDLTDAQKALVDNVAALEAAEAAIAELQAAADQAAADKAAAKAVEDAIAALTQKVFMFNDCDNNNDEGGTEIVANYNSGALDKEITADGYAKFILKAAGAPDLPMTFRCPTGVVASDYDEIVFEIYLSEGLEIVTGSWGNTHYQTAYGGIDEHKVDSVGLASYFEQLVPGQWNTVRMPVTAKTDLIKQITLRPYCIFKGAAGDYVMVDNIRFEGTKEISLDDKAAVAAARAAYDGLTDDQKALVGNVAALEAAEAAIAQLQAAADKAAADAVKAQIAALNVQTLGDKAAVEAARAAYDDLTDAQKALVDNVAALEAAEAAIVALEKAAEEAAADKAAADEVVAIIEALNVQSLEDKAAVEAARTAYAALTDAQKAFVTNLSKLEEAEGVIIAMEAEAADTAAAQAVEDKIAVFKTAANKKGIAAARAAYDALTDAQKAKVSNLARLQELENDAKLVAEVTAMIDAIQPGDQAAISAARAAYNALTFNQKMLITNEHRFVQLEMAL